LAAIAAHPTEELRALRLHESVDPSGLRPLGSEPLSQKLERSHVSILRRFRRVRFQEWCIEGMSGARVNVQFGFAT
jgi:hypothetical protein